VKACPQEQCGADDGQQRHLQPDRQQQLLHYHHHLHQ
jgi:hypothetical protein